MSEIKEIKIILAPRDESFTIFIKTLLSRSLMSQKLIDSITTSTKFMNMVGSAFTHESADPDNNYQFYEKIGDSCVNKCIRFYIIKKFPELHNKQGVEYISELESNWKSTAYLSLFASKLGFHHFISADEDSIMKNIRTRSEDVFEAYVGVLECIIDAIEGECQGYKYCYTFMKSMLDTITVEYTYEQLINSKTRLNELIFGLKDSKLKPDYKTTTTIESDCRVFRSIIYLGGKAMGDSNDLHRLNISYMKNIGVIYKQPYRKKVVADKVAAEIAIYNLIRQRNSGGNLAESIDKMMLKKSLNPFMKK